MNSRAGIGRILSLCLCLTVAACGVVSFISTEEKPEAHFAAHEFAILRGEYESLRSQSVEGRAELFRKLQETLADIRITPGMASSLTEFCEEVSGSNEEHTEVKSEAKLAMEALHRHLPSGGPARAPASRPETRE